MKVTLSINAHETSIDAASELRQLLGDFAGERYKEIWLAKGLEPSLCALLNGNRGWLTYMRTAENGLRSMDSNFPGDHGSVLQYRLSNGQIDEYPASWALEESVILSALEYFLDRAEPAPFVTWRSW